MTFFCIALALVVCAAPAFAGGSCQGVPMAVLDVPYTFALQGANQTINGDYMICADLGNSTSGLAIYVQSLDNAAPALSSGAVNAGIH